MWKCSTLLSCYKSLLHRTSHRAFSLTPTHIHTIPMFKTFFHSDRAHLMAGEKPFSTTSRTLSSLFNPENKNKECPAEIRCITMDVTGTIVSFEGRLGKWYTLSAERVGLEPPSMEDIEDAFHKAYKETSKKYPCFGGSTISTKKWWRICVLRSFELAGTHYTSEADTERLFQRIYALFGSHSTYSAFSDAVPFLKWAERNGLVTGVISNADERYGDSILPMLDLSDDLSFFCCSKDVLAEKPNQKIFEYARKSADSILRSKAELSKDHKPLLPEQMLHIGNDLNKDFFGARDAGLHALLLDRYMEEEVVEEWRKKGAPVMRDLLDVVEWLGRHNVTIGDGLSNV